MHVTADNQFFNLARVKHGVICDFGCLHRQVATSPYPEPDWPWPSDYKCDMQLRLSSCIYLFAQRADIYAYQCTAFVAQRPGRHIAQYTTVNVVHAVDFYRRKDNRYRARSKHTRHYLATVENMRPGIVKVRCDDKGRDIEVFDILFIADSILDELNEFIDFEKPALAPAQLGEVAETPPPKISAMSIGLTPAAYKTAITEPALTPAMASGRKPASSIAIKAPTWAKPRAPPPLSATPN